MGDERDVRMAPQLAMLLTNRGQFAQLEDAYCRRRSQLPPTAAFDGALAELLPASAYEAVAAFNANEREAAHTDDPLPSLNHSLIGGLEDIYEHRLDTERDRRRERMNTGALAADLGADARLAGAYAEGDDEAAKWLERFPSIVYERASASPTPTGRKLRVDQALKALWTTATDLLRRGGDDTEAQVAWCTALRDRLSAGQGHGDEHEAERPVEARVDEPRADPPVHARADEVDDPVEADIETEPERPTTPTSPILDALRSAISYLRDEDRLTALIEAANGQDDHYDPVSAETAEAMERLLQEQVLESDDSDDPPLGYIDGRVRRELWSSMLLGYRVGRYLLTTDARRPPSRHSKSPSFDVPALVSYVREASRRRDVADLVTAPDLSAALHYHPVSASLLRACAGDKALARRCLWKAEDLGFLTSVGTEDLSGGPMRRIDEARPDAATATGR